MGQTIELQYYVTEDSIAVYWEPLDGIRRYRVMLNGELFGETGHTHCSLDALQSETAYSIEVSGVDEDGMMTGQAVLAVTTLKTKRRIDVTQAPYGAVGDGRTMNTAAIQRAFDDCGIGECVYFPAGIYMTGALRMHSDMELYLEEDAVLQGTDVVEDYLPRIKSRFEGIENESYSSLLNLGELDHDAGYTCQNVVIRGKGTIASGGKTLAERVIASERERLQEYLEALGDKINECEKPETIPGRVRPRLINMSNCQNVLITGVNLKNGASWNLHMIYSDRIVTSYCHFYSEGVWNGDGWDPDSSTNCTLFGCEFHTGDDAVAIKSGKNPEGNVINRPTEHIRIFDCKCDFGHGITIGSEMSGGINDVYIWDCDMSQSLCGFEIKGTAKRGGYVRNVRIADSKAARVMFHSVLYNDDGIGAEVPPLFEDCVFERVHITGMYFNKKREWKDCEAIELCGFEAAGHELRNIRFSDIVLGLPEQARPQNISLRLCRDITLSGIRCY